MALLISARGASVLVGDGAPPLVYDRLQRVLPAGMVEEIADPTTVQFDVRYDVALDPTTDRLQILREDRVVARAVHVRGLCRKLRGHVEHQLAVHARTAQYAHAGVVGWRGRAVLVVGDSNAGKTTLVAELVRLGAEYYSDEYAVIDDEGLVHPYARRIGPLHNLEPDHPLLPLEPVVIVATTYDPASTWSPEVQHGARAVLPLLDHLFTTRAEPGRAMRLAATLAPKVVTLQGPRPEAADVAPAILDFVDRALGEEGGPPQALARDARVDLIVADPRWVPVQMRVKTGRIRFRELDRPFYFAQSQAHVEPDDVELPVHDVELAAAHLREPERVQYVYHHGYAGSTLLSRLLDQPGISLPYIEPSLHSGRYDDPLIRTLLSRTFQPGETPVIKVLPHEVLRAARHFDEHPQGRGVFLYARVEDYVASVLPKPYRHGYVTKMAKWFDRDVTFDDPGAAAAFCWEQITGAVVAAAGDLPIRTVFSHDLFADPVATMTRIWEWFGFPPRDDWADAVERVTSTHAKQSRPFTPADRAQQQAEYADVAREWRLANGEVIERGRITAEALARLSV